MRAVIIACTAAKGTEPTTAGRLYTGVAWSTWRAHAWPSLNVPNGWTLWALSAKCGLIEAHKRIKPYDCRLNNVRRAKLGRIVRHQWDRALRWQKHLSQSFTRELGDPRLMTPAVAMIGGSAYQQLAIDAGLPVVIRIDGEAGPDANGAGIGVMRQRIAHWTQVVAKEGNADPYAHRAWSYGLERYSVMRRAA